MKVSYEWLKDFFEEGAVPDAETVAEKLTFHAWEIEGIEEKQGDQIIEVNVLPDTSSWALSHRGVAKNVSAILNVPLSVDPLSKAPELTPTSDAITINIESKGCTRYSAARIDGVKVGPSPEWLQKRLKALGQKPINNVVDAANYVMFNIGQPLHAFDAGKLDGTEDDHIVVRNAKEGETITVLTGEEYTLTKDDMLIVDGGSDVPVGIAGIKGGKAAEVTSETTNLLIESANFDATTVRKSSQRLRLRTDASQRYENGVVQDMTAYGLRDVVALILELAGGELQGYQDVVTQERTQAPVSASLLRINALLGLTLSIQEVASIFDRFGYTYTIDTNTITVTPPFERTDLLIEADLIEEIGRIHGYEHVKAITPEPIAQKECNKRFLYGERVRNVLVQLGFSEVLTSSFREKDTVHLANALAKDKEYLRSSLMLNIEEVLEKNRVNADLLGVDQIRVFEIGTVFEGEGEHTALTLGVRSPGGYKAKRDDSVVTDAVAATGSVLDIESDAWTIKNGVAEVNLDAAIETLETPDGYDVYTKADEDVTYVPFSTYPFISRDIAMWTEDMSESDIRELIVEEGGPLLVRNTLFDRFEKDGRVSYAFRLVFQSNEKTLTDKEVNTIMEEITKAVEENNCEVR